MLITTSLSGCTWLGLTFKASLSGRSLCKAVVIQRSKRNRLIEMNADGLPDVILYSSFQLLFSHMQSFGRGMSSGITPVFWEGAALSLCHLCACFTSGYVKGTNTFIFDFPPQCLPSTSSHRRRSAGPTDSSQAIGTNDTAL